MSAGILEASRRFAGVGLRRSVWEVLSFSGRLAYRIGGATFTLDEIEQGVLRGNRPRVIPPWRAFGRRDPRRSLAFDVPDPRIHFALNCGARSCPPVGVYHASVIDVPCQAFKPYSWTLHHRRL